jgi:hypothetical protein
VVYNLRMVRTLLVAITALFAVSPAYSRTFATEPSSPTQLCATAIDAVEQLSTLPPHLLSAIALVESGRLDRQTRTWEPWPWTINVGGRGYFFASKAYAINAVRQVEALGITSVDIGCMQINLQQHPHAFANLEIAFDPETNARYASRFLTELFTSTRSWVKAAEWYHSATPALGIPYQRKVMALLHGVIGLTPAEREARQQELQRKALMIAWAATLDQTGDEDSSSADGQ